LPVWDVVSRLLIINVGADVVDVDADMVNDSWGVQALVVTCIKLHADI
jgi:hypothetical protein